MEEKKTDKEIEEEERSFFNYLGANDYKPSIFTRIKWKIERAGDFFRAIKWFFQRVFRSYHSSDCDLWELFNHLSSIILKKLKAFIAQDLHGYPAIFSEYAKNEWGSKKEYNEAKAKGEVLGGEQDAWLKALNEMVFAFEFLVSYEDWNEKKKLALLEKYNLKDPHERIPENRKVSYVYKHKENGSVMLSGFSPEEEKDKNYNYLGEDISYYNFELEREYYKRVQAGLNLFSKYFMSLWD